MNVSVQDFNLDPVYKSTGGGSSTPCIPPCRFRWSPLESVTICAIFNLESPLGCRWSPLGWRLVGRPGSAGSPRSLGHPASSTAIIHHRVYMRVSAIFAQKPLLTVRTGSAGFFCGLEPTRNGASASKVRRAWPLRYGNGGGMRGPKNI